MEFNENKLKGIACRKLGHLNKTLEFICTSPTCDDRILCSVCLLKDHGNHSKYITLIDFLLFDKKPVLIEPSQFEVLSKIKEIVDNEEIMLQKFKNNLIDEKKAFLTFWKTCKSSFEKEKESIFKNMKESQLFKSENLNLSIEELNLIVKGQKNKCDDQKVLQSPRDLELYLGFYNSEEKDFSMENLPQSFFEFKLLKTLKNKIDSKKNSELHSHLSSFSFISNYDDLEKNPFPFQIRKNLKPPFDKNPSNFNLKDTITFISEHKKSIRCIVFLDNEKLFATASDDGIIKLWDFKKMEIKKTFNAQANKILTMIQVGEKLVSAGNDQKIHIWNFKDEESISENKLFVGHYGVIHYLLELPNDKLMSGSYDKTIKCWDLKTGKCYETIKAENQGKVYSLTFINNAELAVGNDNNINIYQMKAKKNIKVLEGHTDAVKEIISLYVKKLLISGSDDNSIRIWDLNTEKCVQILLGHKNQINSLVLFSENIIISSAEDSSLKFWDIESKNLIHSIEKVSINSIKVAKDGRMVTVGTDKTIKIWK